MLLGLNYALGPRLVGVGYRLIGPLVDVDAALSGTTLPIGRFSRVVDVRVTLVWSPQLRHLVV